MEGVSTIIQQDGKYLLGTETKQSPLTGKWRLLGGKVEPNEIPEQTAVRELYEEAGIEIRVLKHLDIKKGTHRPINIHIYLAEKVSGELKPNQKEVGQLEYFTLAEIQQLNICPLSKKIIEEYDQIKNY